MIYVKLRQSIFIHILASLIYLVDFVLFIPEAFNIVIYLPEFRLNIIKFLLATWNSCNRTLNFWRFWAKSSHSARDSDDLALLIVVKALIRFCALFLLQLMSRDYLHVGEV